MSIVAQVLALNHCLYSLTTFHAHLKIRSPIHRHKQGINSLALAPLQGNGYKSCIRDTSTITL